RQPGPRNLGAAVLSAQAAHEEHPLSGVLKINNRVLAARAVVYESATGRAKSASTRGRGGIGSVVGYPLRGWPPNNPSVTGGERGKADCHLPWQTAFS